MGGLGTQLGAISRATLGIFPARSQFPAFDNGFKLQSFLNPSNGYSAEFKSPPSELEMARMNGLEKMSYAELSELRSQIDRLMIEQSSERSALRQKMADMARDHGLSLDEVLGKGRKGKGSVAPKYRDPKNPENTWTGRGRMPLWMVAATKGNKTKKDDFLI